MAGGRGPGIPAMTAAQAVASRVGAPLGHDYAVISLSDRLKPWDVVAARLTAAAAADLVLAIYNPASRTRTWQVGAPRDLLLAPRPRYAGRRRPGCRRSAGVGGGGAPSPTWTRPTSTCAVCSSSARRRRNGTAAGCSPRADIPAQRRPPAGAGRPNVNSMSTEEREPAHCWCSGDPVVRRLRLGQQLGEGAPVERPRIDGPSSVIYQPCKVPESRGSVRSARPAHSAAMPMRRRSFRHNRSPKPSS